MSLRRIRPSNNRTRIYHFLRRSLRYHANVSGQAEYDVTDLLRSIERARAEGRNVTFVATLAKATGLVMRRNPPLNRHLFHGIFRRYEVQFEAVNCAVLVARRVHDETVLLPAVIRDADERSVDDIAASLDDYKHRDVEALEEHRALVRLAKLPMLVRKFLAFRASSDARFYERHVAGTYGISSFVNSGSVPITTTHAISPYACSFFPGTIVDRPWVVGGSIVVRKMMTMTLVVDHFLVDGLEARAAVDDLGRLLRDPAMLGLPAARASTNQGATHANEPEAS